MKTVVECHVDGTATIKVIDLTGDAWEDYRHYLSEARSARDAGDTHGMNRALRGALSNVISHLDGIVCDLHEQLSKRRSDFKPRRRKNGRRPSLQDKISDLRDHCTQRMGGTLPDLGIELIKPLRDILAHPSVKKTPVDPTAYRKVELSEASLFELTIEDLESCGGRIAAWLDELCRVYGCTRIEDTKRAVEHVANALGSMSDPPREL